MSQTYLPHQPQHPLVRAWYSPSAVVDTRDPLVVNMVRSADTAIIRDLLNLFYWEQEQPGGGIQSYELNLLLGCIGRRAVTPSLEFYRRYEHPAGIQRSLVTLLGTLKVVEAAPDLMTLLHKPTDERLSVLAALALAQIGDVRAVPGLIEHVSAWHPQADRFAVALGMLRHPEGFAPLHHYFTAAADPDHRRAGALEGAAKALGLQADQRAVPALLRQIYDPSPNVRFAMCVGLGQLGGGRGIDILAAQSDDATETYDGERVGWAARLAYGRLTNRWDFESLIEIAARTNDDQLHRWATEGMAVLGGDVMVSRLLEITQASYLPWRMHAIEALGQTGNAAAIDPLAAIAATDVGVTYEGQAIADTAQTAIAQIRYLSGLSTAKL